MRRFAIASGSGQASPRASTVVTIGSVTRWSLAAVLATGEPERLYTGLSVLVSTAADGAPCGALATFRALELMLAERLPSPRGLGELRDTALELASLEVFACSASTQAVGSGTLEVLSMPRFLRRAEGARLIFV
jgi:hypothetical protein